MKLLSIFRIFKSRRLSYTLAALVVVAINGNALAAPVMDRFEHYNSHRQSQAEQYGQWDTLKQPSPVRSIHAALLRTGKVLLIAGSGNDEKQFNQKSFRTVLWDPTTNEFKNVPTPWDAFCAGHVFLPDGKLLVAGGTGIYEDLEKSPKQEFAGIKDSYEFDPITERYQKVDPMNYARWYPTLVGLPNGNVLASSGLDEKGEILYGQTETYDPVAKKWTDRGDLNRFFPTYPALILAADGRLIYTGSNAGYGSTDQGRKPGLWNLADNTFQEIPGIADPLLLETSASLLLPPAQDQRFMVLGGGGVGESPKTSDKTHIVDLTKPNPAYEPGPNLKEGTRYLNAVILPDDTVFTSGGSRAYRADDIHSAAVFNPATNQFSKAATPRVGRNYHTEAILLPDGRVATFGSDTLNGTFEMRIEVYSPAYLFKGKRPVIFSGGKEMERGTKVDFKTTNPGDISTAKLIRPSSVTHVTDVEQRSIKLDFTRNAEGISATIPDNINILPAGWYMAYVTNHEGVPSEAFWVHVK